MVRCQSRVFFAYATGQGGPTRMRTVYQIAIFLLLCAYATVAHAQGPTQVPELTLQTGANSRYIAADGRPNTRSPVSQSSLLVKLPLGFMAGVWHTTGFDSEVLTDGDDEIVAGAGWHGSFKSLNYEFGVKQFFNYGERGREFIPEVEVGHIAVDSGLNRVRPYINLETPLSHGNWGLEVSGGIEHDMHGHIASLKHRASVQHNTRHNGHDAVTLVTYRAGLIWRVTQAIDDSMRIVVHGPRLQVFVPLHHAHGYHPEHSFGVSIEVNWRPSTATPPFTKTIVAR